jgi:eukaryotic-like serine/threonine-protein kinase
MLIDFGIAKESGGEAVTRTIGRAVTHGFSPPEQVLGTGTDVRSDVYALGAILYAAITGKVPPPAHERVTGTALEPPASLVPEIPPLLDATIRQALELNLHARPQSVAELARTLALVRSGGTGERTVFVSDPSTLTASLGTHHEVRLPSVKLPSTHYTQSAEPASPVPVEPRRRGPRPGLMWSAVGVVLVGLAVAGAWVYLKEVAPEQPATPKTAATPTESTSSSPPTSAPGVAVPSPMPSPPPIDSGAAPQATAASPTPGDSAGSGDLPSIFSFEQEKPQVSGKHQPSDSLMELFEQQRAASQSKSGLPETAADPATTTAGPSTVQSPPVAADLPKKDATNAGQPKPKPPTRVTTAETKPPEKTQAKRATPPKSPSRGASGSGSSRYTPEQLRAIKRFNDM